MSVSVSADLRKKVTAWLNSPVKNFEEGLLLLNESGYKPNVYRLICKKEDEFSRDKLRNELSGYLRYFRNPQSPVHEDIEAQEHMDMNGIDVTFKTHKDASGITVTATASSPFPPTVKDVVNTMINLDKEYAEIREERRQSNEDPKSVRRCWHLFDELYTERSKMHRALKDVGERNDLQSIKQRQSICTAIEALSIRMDALYSAIEIYKSTGIEPDNLLFESGGFDPDAVKDVPTKEGFVLADTQEGLFAQKRNIQSRITKHQNMLLYQSTKKKETETPMPAGPKRQEKEEYVAVMLEELAAIDAKMATLK